MKAKITYLGGPETGDVGRTTWGGHEFELNKAVEVTDQHIIEKAQNNRFFKVADVTADDPRPAPDGDEDEDENDEEKDDKAPAVSQTRPAPGRAPSRTR